MAISKNRDRVNRIQEQQRDNSEAPKADTGSALKSTAWHRSTNVRSPDTPDAYCQRALKGILFGTYGDGAQFASQG